MALIASDQDKTKALVYMFVCFMMFYYDDEN